MTTSTTRVKGHRYRSPCPALSTDCVVFGLDQDGLQLLLIERGEPPFVGDWALPGGFVRTGESLDESARRELQEETGLADVFLEQLYTFGDVGRDPREAVITVAYYALTNIRKHRLNATTDARAARWFLAAELPPLAFDHEKIVQVALERLQGKVRYRPIGFELLADRFTLSELQHLYETLMGVNLDKRNFRKKVLSFELLVETDEQRREGPGRPARLYRFDKDRYQTLERDGFEMWL